MDLWNHKFLPSPPVNSYKATGINLELLDHTKFRHSVQQTITHLKDQEYLIRETAVLSRMIYRMKLKYRNSKEFKTIEKLKHSLNIFFKTDLITHLHLLLDIIPTYYSINTYLPNRNMVSYILVKIQGMVKLMERIYETCKIAALQINQKISTGHFWKLSFLMFSVISRISVLTKHNTKMLCESYGRLYPYMQKLENNGNEWLPSNYILPSDLREWLAVPWVYEEDYIDLTVQTSFSDVTEILNLIDDDDDEIQISDEYIIINEDESNDIKTSSNKSSLSSNRMRGFSINEDDIGVEIIDDAINKPAKKLNSKNKKKKSNKCTDKKVEETKYIDSYCESSNKIYPRPLKSYQGQSIIIIDDSSFFEDHEDGRNESCSKELKIVVPQAVEKITFQENINAEDFNKGQCMTFTDNIVPVNRKCVKKSKMKLNNIKKGVEKNINSPNILIASGEIKREKDDKQDLNSESSNKMYPKRLKPDQEQSIIIIDDSSFFEDHEDARNESYSKELKNVVPQAVEKITFQENINAEDFNKGQCMTFTDNIVPVNRKRVKKSKMKLNNTKKGVEKNINSPNILIASGEIKREKDEKQDLNSESSNKMYPKRLKPDQEQSIIIIDDSSFFEDHEDAGNGSCSKKLKNVAPQAIEKIKFQENVNAKDFNKCQCMSFKDNIVPIKRKCGTKRKLKSNNTKKVVEKKINSPNILIAPGEIKKEKDEKQNVIIIPDSPNITAGPSHQSRYFGEELKINKNIKEEKSKKKKRHKKIIYRKVSSNWPRKLNMFRNE